MKLKDLHKLNRLIREGGFGGGSPKPPPPPPIPTKEKSNRNIIADPNARRRAGFQSTILGGNDPGDMSSNVKSLLGG